MKKNTKLQNAYSLKTPKDSIELYKNWAKSYDNDFVNNLNYLSPIKITNYYYKFSRFTDVPILDVGAGTGKIGEYLFKLYKKRIIGLDISPEMLDKAKYKNCYKKLIIADLTKKIPIKSNSIGSVLSAGTFTHGHVGSEALDELLRITKPKGLFILSIHKEYFFNGGFKKKFFEIKNQITSPIFKTFKIYGKNNDKKHGDDKAFAAIFRKKE